MNVLKLADYKAYCLDKELSPNTIKNYLTTLRQFDRFLQQKNISSINKEATIAYKQSILDQKYSLKTINQKIVILNVYLNWLNRPDLRIKMLKQQSEIHRISINEKEYRRLLHHSEGETQLFILTIANTGLRITELCHLTKEDLNHRSIAIRNKGKTRVIALPVFVKKKLKRFMAYKPLSAIIFSKTQSAYRAELKRVAALAHVNKKKVYPHSFRHYFAKQFIANGGDSTELQQMLGHSSIETTTIYTHLDSTELSQKFAEIRNT